MFSNNIIDIYDISSYSISNLFQLFINHFGIYIPFLIIFIYLHYRILKNQHRSFEKWIFPIFGLILIIIPTYSFIINMSKVFFIIQNNASLISTLVPKYMLISCIYFIPHTLFVLIPLIMTLVNNHSHKKGELYASS